MSQRQLLHEITCRDFNPFFGHYEANLTTKGAYTYLCNTDKVGKSWLESCFLDQRSLNCASGIIVEADVKIKSVSPSTLFLVYVPSNQTYFVFQLCKDSVYAVVSRLNSRCHKYQRKINKYQHLTTQYNTGYHEKWKKQCSLHSFIRYALYWMWKEECTCQGHEVCDYTRFLDFRQGCRITYHGDDVTIKSYRDEVVFVYKKWQNFHGEDYEEWKNFCLWKKNYYIQRCCYYETKPEINKIKVAECQEGKAHLSFIVYPNQVLWKIDGYQVYSYTPLAPICRFHVGVGIGNGCETLCQERYLCRFTLISVYLVCDPIKQHCLTTTDKDESSDKESSCSSYEEPCKELCISKESCPINFQKKKKDSCPISKESCDFAVKTHCISSSTVKYQPGHNLSAGAETSCAEETSFDTSELERCAELTSNC